MKKLSLLFAAMFCIAGQANAQQYGQELELGSIAGWGWSAKTIVISDEEIPQLPASVNLPGQYGEISVTESFNAADIKSFKFELAEPTEAGKIQISVRNQAQTSTYQNQYIHLEAGITSYEGTIDMEQLGEDTQVVAFAFMNDGNQDAVTFTLNSFVFIKNDGTEWVPTWKGSGWPTGSLTPLTQPEGSESKDVYEFTNQYGEMGVDFGEAQVIAADKPHIFTLVSSEPIPAGEFQWKVYNEDGSNSYYAFTVDPENIVTFEMPANYTGISIQHTATTNSYLPQDIKLYRLIVGGPLVTERLPIVVGSQGTAEIIDPNPGEEMGANGLPIGVNLPGSWGSMGLWNVPFNAAEYPMFKVVLREKPTDVQFFYRTHVVDAEGGSTESTVYVPWATSEDGLVELSEDGCTLTGEFDIDALGDVNVEAIALQNTGGSAVKVVVMQVYLMNEDEEWIETPGLGSSISLWNSGSTYAVSGSYDDDGNIWDAYVKFNAVNDYLGTYSGTVEEGTYHKVTFYTEEPLPDGFVPVCMNIGLDWNTWQWTFENLPYTVEGQGTNALSVNIPLSYNSLYISYMGPEENLPCQVRFTKVVREVYEATPEYYAYGIVSDFNGWDNDAFMIEDPANPGIYTTTLTNQEIKEIKEYGYKVRANKSWNLYQLPTEGNLTWTPEKSGIYSLTFTFNRNDGTCTIDAVRTGDCTWTATFVNTCGWEKVYAYTFNPELNGSWPGVELSIVSHNDSLNIDTYSYSVTSENMPANIIFNAGEGKPQTRDLAFEDGKEYVWNAYTVTYVNVENWPAVYAYTFDPEAIGAWPGTPMTKTGETVEGHDVYTITFGNDAAPASIIFNNGDSGDTNQTADLVFENGKQYDDPAKKPYVSIGEITIDLTNAVIYDITGKRVDTVKQGLYIINGKKVIVK
jgi:hypothetical protein